jgi:hypothetical protein
MTWALSLIPILAMSVRNLLTGHEIAVWPVGSFQVPYLLRTPSGDLRICERLG